MLTVLKFFSFALSLMIFSLLTFIGAKYSWQYPGTADHLWWLGGGLLGMAGPVIFFVEEFRCRIYPGYPDMGKTVDKHKWIEPKS